jgi:phosphatidylserine/phosphatidylglycerophosphate/cardiolipin synthase-like enzyme
MAAFVPMVDPAQVAAAVEATIRLRDRYDASEAPANPSRYQGATVRGMRLSPAGASFRFDWPATGAARLVDLAPDDAAALGFIQLVELSPLPFAIEAALRRSPAGLPTFYIGLAGPTLPGTNELVTRGGALDVTGAFVGVLFQDRVALAPWAWIDAIAGALADVPADADAWRAQAALFATRSLRVLDAAGRPAAGANFQVRLFDAGGTLLSDTTVTSDAGGDLAGAIPPAGQHAELTWQPPPVPSDVPLPVMALYERALADPGDAGACAFPSGDTPSPLVLPDGFAGGHLQVLDLAAWLSPRVENPRNLAWPLRFHPGSRIEPLVDGAATYARLVPDIRASRFAIPGAGAGGTHFLGWHFGDFPLVRGDAQSNLVALVDAIRDPAMAGTPGEMRILAAQFVVLNPSGATALSENAGLTLAILLTAAGGLLATSYGFHFNRPSDVVVGWPVLLALTVGAYWLELGTGGDIADFLHGKIEETKQSLIDTLNTRPNSPGTLAHYAPHPARFADNPVADPLMTNFSLDGVPLHEADDHFGIFHDKVQVIRRSPADGETPATDGYHYVGYLGGIDINTNRLDSPGHHGAAYRAPDDDSPPRGSPFHDVHARLTGPAVTDLAGFFDDRYAFALTGGDPGVAIDPPAAFAPPVGLVQPTGRHLVQVARTTFAPGTPGGGFPHAPDGGRPIRDTLMRAIASAHEYIYIEDQYFTPDNGYVHALEAAASPCRRLVILVPGSTSDQVFGDERRIQIFARLQAAWGERVLIGTPVRRPAAAPAARSSSIGRGTLNRAIGAGDSSLEVVPPTRMETSGHYFVWVGGELMYVTGATVGVDSAGKPMVRLDVLRERADSTSPAPFALPRAHAAGEPVTAAHPSGIYVHAKVMMVDDVFVSIGSCNLNRRGFFHDGEVNSFTIPERIKGDRDNPARALRTALWAEHLGIPPAMGASLFADPIGGYELFRRSRYQGNRFIRYPELLVPPYLGISDMGIPEPLGILVQGLVATAIDAYRQPVWNTVIDPDTHNDPNHEPGPDVL